MYDLGFEGQTGIRFSFTDSLVVRGKNYRYAVTSFTIPDYTIVEHPIPGDGGTTIDTLTTNPVESQLVENVQSYQIPFAVSKSVGGAGEELG